MEGICLLTGNDFSSELRETCTVDGSFRRLYAL